MPDFIKDQNNIPLPPAKSLDGLQPNLPARPPLFKIITSFIWEVVKVVVISLAIIIPIRMYVVQPFIVEGASMEPNFYDGEYLVVDEISYRFTEIKRGDVVIFHPPKNPEVYYIKRVIGLPGESIEIKQGKIYIYNEQNLNGKVLDEEEYLAKTVPMVSEKNKVDLKQGQYYLLGDHRVNSQDSRMIGPIELKAIKGKVLLRAYPFNRFSFFSVPDYNL